MKNAFQKIEAAVKSLLYKIKKTISNFIYEFNVAKKKLKNFTETNYNLGIYHINKGNMTDAKMRFFFVTKLDPNFALAHYHLARCHLFNLDFKKADKELSIALSLDQNLTEAKYRMKLLNKNITNEPIPLKVIEEDYNNLADKYESLLEGQQIHDAADTLAKLISKYMEGIEDPFALDLGCGTGLMGFYLKQVVAIKSLLGVDISDRMLDLAKELAIDDHNVYNHTKKLDFSNLSTIVDRYDIITACMSFNYISDLTKVFKNIEKVRAKRTILGLVLLKTTKGDVVFNYKNGCYSFSLEYLKDIFKKFEWTILEQKDIKSFLNGEHGLVLVLKK